MRNMSFALTVGAMQAHTKTVTRRLGWLFLKPGDLVQPVRKCMGLRPGEKIEKICDPVRVVSVRRERLSRLIDDREYGRAECILEGFGDHELYRHPAQFAAMFCRTHKGCFTWSSVTRIEFEWAEGREPVYVDVATWDDVSAGQRREIVL